MIGSVGLKRVGKTMKFRDDEMGVGLRLPDMVTESGYLAKESWSDSGQYYPDAAFRIDLPFEFLRTFSPVQALHDPSKRTAPRRTDA